MGSRWKEGVFALWLDTGDPFEFEGRLRFVYEDGAIVEYEAQAEDVLMWPDFSRVVAVTCVPVAALPGTAGSE